MSQNRRTWAFLYGIACMLSIFAMFTASVVVNLHPVWGCMGGFISFLLFMLTGYATATVNESPFRRFEEKIETFGYLLAVLIVPLAVPEVILVFMYASLLEIRPSLSLEEYMTGLNTGTMVVLIIATIVAYVGWFGLLLAQARSHD